MENSSSLDKIEEKPFRDLRVIPRIVAAASIGAICFLTAVPCIWINGLGLRGEKKVWDFFDDGKRQAVMREYRICGRDRYYFKLGTQKKGTLISDHGSKVTIFGGRDPNYGFKWEYKFPEK